MTHPTGFHLHHGNRLPLLVQALGDRMHDAGESDWLRPETVLIPQPSMRRWLQNSLAGRFGIAANIDFLPPGAFIDGALAPWFPAPAGTPLLNPERLRWRLLRLLLDDAVLARPGFTPVAAYLQAGDRQGRAWQLAGELARSFEKYQAWRRHWLLQWSRKPPPHDWQAQLWQLASHGMAYRAQALEAYFGDLQRPDCPRPAGLPARLFVFACQNLSPDVLRVLQSFGRWSRVEFFLHNPCEAYWGDVRAPKSTDEILALHEDNPLLNQWGFAGRDFIANLLSDQSVEWAGEQSHYQEAVGAEPIRLLQRLQDDIQMRAAPEPAYADAAALAGDGSLQIHNCASALREVQMLRAQLLALLQADPSLHWRDIAVMAPDLDAYAPHFSAVFGRDDDGYPALPFSLGDRGLFRDTGVAEVFFRLLALGRSRFTSNEGFELLGHPLVAGHYGLDPSDLARLHAWLVQAEVRWGLDAAHRAGVDGGAQDEFTWRHGLKRLLYGYASDDPLVADIAPADLPSGQQRALLDILCRFIDGIDGFRAALGGEHPAPEWQALLSRMLEAFCRDPALLPDAEREAYNHLNARIAALPVLAQEAGLRGPLWLELIESYLADEGEQRLGQAWLSGRITVCKMVPMRLIPFKVICLLGLDEAGFPRQEPESAIDQMRDPQARRLPGDRNTRDDDRFLMLQTLCACQDRLILSYVGTDPLTGADKPPSVLVRELLDTIGRYRHDGGDLHRHFIIRHPIHGHEAPVDARAAWLPPASPAGEPVPGPPLFAPMLSGPPQTGPEDPPWIGVDAFIRFWQKPVESLAGRLGLRLPERGIVLEESEPYGAASGLAKYRLVEATLEQRRQDPGISAEALLRRFQAQGLLPPGAAGRSRFLPVFDAIANALDELARVRIAERAWPIALDLAPARLEGTLIQDFSPGMVNLALHAESPRPRDHVRTGITALLALASGYALPAFTYTDRLHAHALTGTPEQAGQRLQPLLRYYLDGQRRIVCFDPKHSFDWLQARRDAPELDVHTWLAAQIAAEEASQAAFGDSGNLRFLTHGAGFLQGVALRDPQAFDTTATAVYAALMGEQDNV